jgi:hypothetical protein
MLHFYNNMLYLLVSMYVIFVSILNTLVKLSKLLVNLFENHFEWLFCIFVIVIFSNY